MKKQDIKYWLLGTACLGMLTTVTGCKDDDFPDKDIPTAIANSPVEPTEQVYGPDNLSRVSVHDPSVVWDPSSWSFYIFGSHRATARSVNMMTWTTVDVPWAADGSTGVGNDKAFVTPEVKTVKKGGQMVDLPAFNAYEWSKKGNASWSIDGNMWAPDVIYNKEMKKWCMYLSINGDSWYSSVILLTSDFIVGPYTYQAPVVVSGSMPARTTRRPTSNWLSVRRRRCPNAMPWAASGATAIPTVSTPACSTTSRASSGCRMAHRAVASGCSSSTRLRDCATTTSPTR